MRVSSPFFLCIWTEGVQYAESVGKQYAHKILLVQLIMGFPLWVRANSGSHFSA
jgi:hypothetical protein